MGAGKAQGINGLPAVIKCDGWHSNAGQISHSSASALQYLQLFLIYAAVINTPAHGNVQKSHGDLWGKPKIILRAGAF